MRPTARITARIAAGLTAVLAAVALLPGRAPGAPARPTSPVLTAACAGTLQAAIPGTVQGDALTEVSGIAASHRNRHVDGGVYWVHNDSGDSARVFAIDEQGMTLGEFALDGAQAVDWEDIAVAPGPGRTRRSRTWSIFVADIGDNAAARSAVTVYRVPEPVVAPAGDATPRVLPGAAALTFTYPDGPHDAEALLVDPAGKDLLIVTKDLLGGRGVVYRGAADATAGTSAVLERVGDVSLGLGRGVTGGDVTWNGDTVALRTYLGIVLYPRPAGKPLWQAFTAASCTGAAPPVIEERQGEAVGFVPGGRAYLTVGEGAHPPVHRFTAPG